MHLFLYELVTGGGFLADDQPPPESLLAEGRAMLAALAADFLAIDGVRISILRDARLDVERQPGCEIIDVASPAEELAAFDRLAHMADWSVVIAPELGGLLHGRATRVVAVGGRLLGPDCEFIDLASNKQRTADHLRAAGVATPVGRVLRPGERLPEDFLYPAVLKPLDGAGSQEVRLIAGPEEVTGDRDRPYRLEKFCPGMAASVAVLSGVRERIVLPACRQLLSADGCFTYLGGELPLPAALNARAARLAEQVADALPPVLGYWGVDLMLGAAEDGHDDVVIEINPRLTTSYVGLRALAESNLAAAMLALAEGRAAAISFGAEPVRFGGKAESGGSKSEVGGRKSEAG